MGQIYIDTERDRVILSFGNRGQDLCLSPDMAMWVSEAIQQQANECERWVKSGGSQTLVRGEPRGALVKSWDGKVNIRFDIPTNYERIPYQAARLFANEIKAKVVEAQNRMTLDIQLAARPLGV